MTLLTWLKFAHILGAMIWIGGGVMLSLIGIRTRQSEDPHYIREFSRTLSYVGLRVLMPAVIAVLVFGVWMVLAFSAWQFTQPWILLALGAFALAFVIGAVYLSRIALALDKLTATISIWKRPAICSTAGSLATRSYCSFSYLPCGTWFLNQEFRDCMKDPS